MVKRTLVALSIIITLGGCKKGEGVSSVPGGKAEMELNGEAWTGELSWMDNDTAFSFSVTKYRQFGNDWLPDQDFHIGNIKKTLLRTQLSEAYFFTSDNGDTGCGNYAILSTDSLDNWIEITKEKDNYIEMWGKFNITFYRVDGCPASTLPDTLRITKGTFHVY